MKIWPCIETVAKMILRNQFILFVRIYIIFTVVIQYAVCVIKHVHCRRLSLQDLSILGGCQLSSSACISFSHQFFAHKILKVLNILSTMECIRTSILKERRQIQRCHQLGQKGFFYRILDRIY